MGHTSQHLHLRMKEHKYSVMDKHLKDKHNQSSRAVYHFKEMQRKVWVPYLWDAFNKETETDSLF